MIDSIYRICYRQKVAIAMLFSYLPTMIIMKQTKMMI